MKYRKYFAEDPNGGRLDADGVEWFLTSGGPWYRWVGKELITCANPRWPEPSDLTVTIVAEGESDKAIVIKNIDREKLTWLLTKVVAPLEAIGHRDYAGGLVVYEGDVTHKCSEEQWCEPTDCCYIGSVDYNLELKKVRP